MSKLPTFERFTLIPIAVAFWMGWFALAGDICGKLYVLCRGTHPWLELLVLPVAATVLASVNVVRATVAGAVGLVVGGALSTYGALYQVLSAGDQPLFIAVAALSFVGIVVGCLRVGRSRSGRRGAV